MRLTTRSEYSLLALIFIARNGGGNWVKIERICQEYGLSKKYLEQFLGQLKRNHYLKAKRGLNGGYSLARDPRQISIAEIVRLMDGPLAPTESASVFFFEKTPIGQESKLIEEFREIRNYVSTKLEALRLSDLL